MNFFKHKINYYKIAGFKRNIYSSSASSSSVGQNRAVDVYSNLVLARRQRHILQRQFHHNGCMGCGDAPVLRRTRKFPSKCDCIHGALIGHATYLFGVQRVKTNSGHHMFHNYA